uniref:Methanethiol oxidase n=3 Tax=Lygus hesperus TaxID=30085 RepID=A0A0A9X941_LYGHE
MTSHTSSEGNCQCGPGYSSPEEAMRGPKEKILYVVCIRPNGKENGLPDYLATVDVDPSSPTYSQIIHRTFATHTGDELHHMGWNTCSSCHGEPDKTRNRLVLPSLNSDRIYILSTDEERAPKIHKVIEPEEVHAQNVSFPHTTHCLPSGEVMISTLGDAEGDNKGDFLLIDSKTWTVTGTWTKGDKLAKYGYDFWYQPHHDVMISTEWAAPESIKKGPGGSGDPNAIGKAVNFYRWSTRELIQTVDLGHEGVTPLEVRFLHDPLESQGYFGCCVSSNVFWFYKREDGTWATEKVIDVPSKKVEGFVWENLPGMVSDILISMDDRFIYFSNWLHGDVRQYDISNRRHPKLVGQVFIGGKIHKGSDLKVIEDPELKERPEELIVKGVKVKGGAQMLQLSLDGTRLYVTTSLYSLWDKTLYPDLIEHGSVLLKINVDTVNGGLTVDPDFIVNFGNEPNGPSLAHECRYPGGDCTSDIFLAECTRL